MNFIYRKKVVVRYWWRKTNQICTVLYKTSVRILAAIVDNSFLQKSTGWVPFVWCVREKHEYLTRFITRINLKYLFAGMTTPYYLLKLFPGSQVIAGGISSAEMFLKSLQPNQMATWSLGIKWRATLLACNSKFASSHLCFAKCGRHCWVNPWQFQFT